MSPRTINLIIPLLLLLSLCLEHISCLATKLSHKNIGLIFLLDANFSTSELIIAYQLNKSINRIIIVLMYSGRGEFYNLVMFPPLTLQRKHDKLSRYLILTLSLLYILWTNR